MVVESVKPPPGFEIVKMSEYLKITIPEPPAEIPAYCELPLQPPPLPVFAVPAKSD